MPLRFPPPEAKEDLAILHVRQEYSKPGGKYGPTVRSVYLVECCVAGKGTVTINGRCFPFQGGDCFVVLPGNSVTYTSDAAEPRWGYWCALDGNALESYFREAGYSAEAPFAPPWVFPQARAWLEQLYACWEDQDAGARLRQIACGYGLLGTFLRDRPAQRNSILIEKAIGYMQANYAERLSMDEVASRIGLNRTYFSELFKEKTGLAPHRYLTQLRIRQACRLLESTEYPVWQIAELVGLDSHNFPRLFQRETGKSPRQYRRETQ